MGSKTAKLFKEREYPKRANSVLKKGKRNRITLVSDLISTSTSTPNKCLGYANIFLHHNKTKYVKYQSYSEDNSVFKYIKTKIKRWLKIDNQNI